MSNYHALKQTEDERMVNFVFHYVTPVGQNAAGVDYKDCIKRDKKPAKSIVPNLETDNPTEHAKILTGEIYEELVPINFDPEMTNQQKLTATNARWTAKNTAFQDDVTVIYKFYCMAQDVE